jgi:hypothetical protein
VATLEVVAKSGFQCGDFRAQDAAVAPNDVADEVRAQLELPELPRQVVKGD